MPQNTQLLVLLLLIGLVLVVVLGVWGLFLSANSQARIRKTSTRHANSIASHSGDRLGHRSKLAELEGFSPFADSPWPELHFDMEVTGRRFFGVALVIGGGLVALLLLVFYPIVSARFLLATVLGGPITALGSFLGLSCIQRWQSHVVLESERIVVQPIFGRPVQTVNYNQICYAGEQARGTAVLIRYYPLTLDGQIDRSRMQQLKLPATTHDEGLLLALRARISGLPIDRDLELRLMSKQFIPLLVLMVVTIVGAIAMPATGVDRRLDPMFLGLIVPGFFLLAAMILVGLLARRK